MHKALNETLASLPDDTVVYVSQTLVAWPGTGTNLDGHLVTRTVLWASFD